MTELYVVMRSRGAFWKDDLTMEQQEEWPAHAAFMTRLETEGIVLLGGPLDDSSDVLLVVRGKDEVSIRATLAEDPWCRKDILPLRLVSRWRLRMGVLG